jgi:V/A-type H+-transporting ATPase subunit D
VSGLSKTPTRSALLAMQDEQKVVNEAYTFLDEKRLLLAAELLRQLARYQSLQKALEVLHAQANAAMRSAVMHHGLDGLQVYPAANTHGNALKQIRRNFMGVTLVEIEASVAASEAAATEDARAKASNPSSMVEHCRQLFQEIIVQSAVAAGVSGNLYRLLREYRLTERRSRALENVILPEIKQSLREMSLHLEELDLEDAIRVHLQSGERR